MSTKGIQALSAASAVSGTLKGLSEGITWWKTENVPPEVIDRVAKALMHNHEEMRKVIEYILEQLQAEQ